MLITLILLGMRHPGGIYKAESPWPQWSQSAIKDATITREDTGSQNLTATDAKASREISTRCFKNSQEAVTVSGYTREGLVEAFDQGLCKGGLEQAVMMFPAGLLLVTM